MVHCLEVSTVGRNLLSLFRLRVFSVVLTANAEGIFFHAWLSIVTFRQESTDTLTRENSVVGAEGIDSAGTTRHV